MPAYSNEVSVQIELPEGFATPVAVVGRATVLAGDTFVSVTPGVPFSPESVQATPVGAPSALWGIEDVSSTEFKVVVATSDAADRPFNWLVSQRLPAPVLLEALSGDGEVALTWSVVALATGYTLYWDDDSSGEPYANVADLALEDLTDNGDGTVSYTLSGLTNDVEHFFALLANRTT